MKALATVNYGSVLKPNARASFQAAAKRWEVEYAEMNESTVPLIEELHPAAMKTAMFKVLPYDEIFYCDSDCIISRHCPSPFEVFWGPEELRVVRDSSPYDCREQDWARHAKKMPELLDIPLVIQDYWNSGMFLARRKYHARMFELANWICQTDFSSPWMDQTVFVMSAILEGVKIEYVDERWNYLFVGRIPDFRNIGEHPEYPAWILHGAGAPEREQWLNEVKW